MKEEKNFTEYESHIDSLISQYKSQLESIKSNRINKENGNNENLVTNSSFKTFYKNNNGNEIIKKQKEKLNEENTINFTEESVISIKNPEVIFKNKSKLVSDNIENVSTSYNQKVSTLTEENFKLNEKVNDLEKLKDTNTELKLRCERLNNEINKFTNSESILRKEKFQLQKRIEELENKNNKFENKENKNEEDFKKMNQKLKEVEQNYEELIKNKEEEIEILNKNIKDKENENNKKNSIFQLLSIFFKRNLKHTLDREVISEDINNFKINDYEVSFISIEKLINKLLCDNSELVMHLNKLMNRNEIEEESIRVKKLNQIIEDLRMENHLLKSQINLFSENKSKSKTKSNKNVSRENINLIHNKNDFLTENETDKKEKKIINKKIKKKNYSENSIVNNSDYKENNNQIKRQILTNTQNSDGKLQRESSFNYININPQLKTFNSINTNLEENQNNVPNELRLLENLKSKIKDLENKIGEINKDEKEKKIIDSLKEFRQRNISPNK